MPTLSVLLLLIIEPSVLKVLVFHYKGMLERVSNQSILRFFFVTRKNLVKCSACISSPKIVIECGIAFSEICLFLENHWLEFHEISHENTLGNNY